jgi:diguanylate cyclase (GGDEF)-like protein
VPPTAATPTEVERRARSAGELIPPSYVRYTIVTSAAAVVALAGFWTSSNWSLTDSDPAFWLFAAFVVLGELLPIQVPRRHTDDKVTISTAFAFALLLSFGVGPAMVVYAGGWIVAAFWERAALTKGFFNAAQYILSVAAAAVVLGLAGHPAPVTDVGGALLPILLAAAVWFAVNHVLAGVGAALLTGSPVPAYLVHDLAFQAWTAGFLLILAPIVVVSADESLALIPVCFLPMLAIYLGGRQAAFNAHRAFHDALTDLPNRALLHDRLETALDSARADHRPLVVLIVDLDDFKAVNDSLGYHYGDLLLMQVAPRLRSALRDEDTLARLGGDEFAVLIDGVPGEAHAAELAQRMLRALEAPFDLGTLSLDVRASIGIACFPEHGSEAEELLQHADMALHRAKESELSYEAFAADHDGHSIDRLALASQLRQGIERGELVLHYQRKIPLRRGHPEGVEALVRWQHPELGIIGPDGFIPLAEHTGLITPLTAYVLETALRQSAEWRRSGLSVRVSVNVSTRSLLDREIATTIRGLLAKHELAPESLQLEITESKIVTDLPRARTVLEELRTMGITIAIDDFGTGFSSLTQLQQLPVDEIKIDKSFVMNYESSTGDVAIVRSTIDLGRNLGVHVTAEGVESETVYRELIRLGCDFAQGFHLARPAEARHLTRAMRKRLAGSNGKLDGAHVQRPDQPVPSSPRLAAAGADSA